MHLVLALTLAPALSAAQEVDFDTDLIPVFTRAGCNAGRCHGAGGGSGGFELSLLGGDPTADHESIVQQLEGRRIDRLSPEDSLVIAKPTGILDHEGGLRLDPFGEGAELLERWIAQGAQRRELRQLVGFTVEPERYLAEAPGETFAVRAVATFDDGSERDVTRFTVFTVSDVGALEVSSADDGSGRVTVLLPGASTIVARYLSEVRPVRVLAPFNTRAEGRPTLPRKNFIDDHVNALLTTLGLEAAPPADDAAFLRRTRLAITGTLPGRGEVEAFLEDRSPEKRAALVNRLLASEDFVDYWTYRLSLLLRLRPLGKDKRVARSYQAWLRERVADNTPFDELVRALITASGDSHRNGAAAFHRMTDNARAEAELVSEAFLGARLRCANCHDHPLDRWTRDDYHGLAAVFARIDRGRRVHLKDFGEVTHPATGRAAVPRLPGERFIDAGPGARAELAAWLTDPANDEFARNSVNRIWQTVVGRGLVEPVDDLRPTNPATNPELFDALARDFTENGFDLRRTIRMIATSAAFERAGDADDSLNGARFGASAFFRPLEAEVLADALATATGVSDRYGKLPPETRAITLVDPSIGARGLDLLGRCGREGACDASAGDAAGLAATLHLMNGALVNDKVTDAEGIAARLLARGARNDEVVDELYLRTLSRRPRPDESELWRSELDRARMAADRKDVIEDFLWSLLTCREFMTNH